MINLKVPQVPEGEGIPNGLSYKSWAYHERRFLIVFLQFVDRFRFCIAASEGTGWGIDFQRRGSNKIHRIATIQTR